MEENKALRALGASEWSSVPISSRPAKAREGDPEGSDSLLILGVRQDGAVFRPSDWAERLAGVVEVFGLDAGRALRGLVRMERCSEGVCAVRASAMLRTAQPEAWDFMCAFARENGLRARQEAWPERPAPAPALPAPPVAWGPGSR